MSYSSKSLRKWCGHQSAFHWAGKTVLPMYSLSCLVADMRYCVATDEYHTMLVCVCVCVTFSCIKRTQEWCCLRFKVSCAAIGKHQNINIDITLMLSYNIIVSIFYAFRCWYISTYCKRTHDSQSLLTYQSLVSLSSLQQTKQHHAAKTQLNGKRLFSQKIQFIKMCLKKWFKRDYYF